MADDALNVRITATLQELVVGMRQAVGVVQSSSAEMQSALSGISKVATAVTGAFAAVSAVLAGGKIFGDAISETTDLASALGTLSQQTGVAATELSRLQFAAHMSDISQEEFGSGLIKLARTMEEATQQGSNAARVFETIGVQVRNADGSLRPMNDVLLDVAEKFQGWNDGAGKAAISMELFGKSGAPLIPMLNQGRDGIRRLADESDRLGRTMDEQGVRIAGEYEAAMKRFHGTVDALQHAIALGLMPTLSELADTMTKGSEKASAFADVTNAASKAVKILVTAEVAGLAAASAMAKAIANPMMAMEFFKTAATEAAKKIDDLWIVMGKMPEVPIAGLGGTPDKHAPPILTGPPKPFEVTQDMRDALDVANEVMRTNRDRYNEATREAISGLEALLRAQEEATKETAKAWTSVFDAIPDALGNALRRMTESTATFGQFMRNMFQELELAAISAGYRALTHHIAMELAKKNITIESVTSRVAIETWGALQTVAKSAWAAITSIANAAARAAAEAWAAISAIPFVGPFLAPAVAAGTAAGILALAGGVKSAARGYDIPAGVNPVTQLHAREMVLPQQYADVIRGMAGQGGGQALTVNITALDAKGVRQFVHEHRDAFADATMRALRDGRAVPG